MSLYPVSNFSVMVISSDFHTHCTHHTPSNPRSHWFWILFYNSVVVQLLSCVWLFTTPWTATRQAPLSFTVSCSLSNSCPLIRWCYLTISFSVAPFFFCLQSFPASESFPMSWLFTSVTQVLELQHQPFQWMFRVDFLYDWLVWSPCSPRDSQNVAFSSTTVRKHQFFSTQPSLWCNSHIHTWLLEKPQLWLYGPLLAKWCLCFSIHCLGLL